MRAVIAGAALLMSASAFAGAQDFAVCKSIADEARAMACVRVAACGVIAREEAARNCPYALPEACAAFAETVRRVVCRELPEGVGKAP